MACLDCQVRKVTWDPWELQDLLEDQEGQEDLVVLDKKVNLDSLAEMVPLVVLEVKAREATPVSKDPQDQPCHHQP